MQHNLHLWTEHLVRRAAHHNVNSDEVINEIWVIYDLQ